MVSPLLNNHLDHQLPDASGYFETLSEFMSWFCSKADAMRFEVEEIPLSKISGWTLDPTDKGLYHQSGKFFSIQGINVDISQPYQEQWQQPIIVQPEIGILGIICKINDGVPYFLMQLKMEPGNINKAQLSPTVQATKSNYTRVHRGKLPLYLDYFLDRKGVVIADQLQSEQGSRFLHKRNRNMILLVEDDLPCEENYCWLSLYQIKALYCHDNLVNMDARSVLAMIDTGAIDGSHIIEDETDEKSNFSHQLALSRKVKDKGINRFDDVISWLTSLKSNYSQNISHVALSELKKWVVDDEAITHSDGHYFSVIGVHSTLEGREISEWSQPLLKHEAEGLVGLICQEKAGVLHFLIHARIEPGYIDGIEMGPTVSCGDPSRYSEENSKPLFLSYFHGADASSTRCDYELSEEGGRFYHFRNRYRVIEIDASEQLEIPVDYCWLTYGQLLSLVRHSLYLNIELRSIISALPIESTEHQ